MNSLIVQWLAASTPYSVAVYNDGVAVPCTSNADSDFAESISTVLSSTF